MERNYVTVTLCVGKHVFRTPVRELQFALARVP